MPTVQKHLKILLYTDTPIAGGAENHMHLLAKYLQQMGHSPIVVCSQYPSLDRWCEKMQSDGIEIIRLKAWHKHDPRQLWQLRKVIHERKPDLFHLHLWNPGACRYAFFATSPEKIITTEHDPFELKGLKKILKRWTLSRTKHTIVVSRANEEQMLRWYPSVKNKISVIHNGIEVEALTEALKKFSPAKRSLLRKNLFKVGEKEQVILSIAALHQRKGLLYLLEALEKIQRKIADVKLVIVGEGPQKKELMAKTEELKITDHVLFLGQREDIPEILKSADLFALPSIKEAFGLVLLEAMAAGLPIIASKVGGIPEIIQNGKNGLLPKPADSADLSEKILTLIEHEDFRKNLISHHVDVLKMFKAEVMAKKTAKLYHHLLSSEQESSRWQ